MSLLHFPVLAQRLAVFLACGLYVANGDSLGECNHAACMENGHSDGDCCALSSQGGCASGFNHFTGSTCFTANGAKETCCMSDMCVKSACHENGVPDSDCCGLPDEMSCSEGYDKIVGDICWNPNGARRICCVARNFAPECEHSACTEYGKTDKDCCAIPLDGSCATGFDYFPGSVCYNPNDARETCCLPRDVCTPHACLENGEPDADCCGLEEQTACKVGYHKTVGDICWLHNGARRTCCTPNGTAATELSASGAMPQKAKAFVFVASILVGGATMFIAFKRRSSRKFDHHSAAPLLASD